MERWGLLQFHVNADEWKGSEFKTELKIVWLNSRWNACHSSYQIGLTTHVQYSMLNNAYFDYTTFNFNRNLITIIKYWVCLPNCLQICAFCCISTSCWHMRPSLPSRRPSLPTGREAWPVSKLFFFESGSLYLGVCSKSVQCKMKPNGPQT